MNNKIVNIGLMDGNCSQVSQQACECMSSNRFQNLVRANILKLILWVTVLIGFQVQVEAQEKTTPVKKHPLFGKVIVRDFPIVDSTSFDSFATKPIKEKTVKKLNLHALQPDAARFMLNYGVLFSEEFYSVVITFQSGEHELFTYLVNFRSDGKIMDQLLIAYDEIAESAFSKRSVIEKDKIIVVDRNYMEEEPSLTTTTYFPLENGQFQEDKLQAE